MSAASLPRLLSISALALALAPALVGGCANRGETGTATSEPAPAPDRAGFVAQALEHPARASTGAQGQRDRARPPARAQRAAIEPQQNPQQNPAPAASPSADPFAEAFVRAHDLHRARVSPAPRSPLPSVRWSPELAAHAQAWAERCEFEHSRGEFGENLAARTGAATPDEVVAGWAAEAEDFDYARNRCTPGKVCGHYTQIVWRDSTQIGCGVAQCGGGGPFGGRAWTSWVCNYSPAGNWMGERPY